MIRHTLSNVLIERSENGSWCTVNGVTYCFGIGLVENAVFTVINDNIKIIGDLINYNSAHHKDMLAPSVKWETIEMPQSVVRKLKLDKSNRDGINVAHFALLHEDGTITAGWENW